MEYIYLDNAATTPPDPQVIKAMTQIGRQYFGNPSSQHYFGREAKVKVEESREILANFLGCHNTEIKFTSGGTEANNWAIKTTAFARKQFGNHIIVSAIEHPSVLNSAIYLREKGFDVTFVKPDANGRITVDAVARAIQKNTALISIQYVNNEIGVIQPIEEIGALCKAKKILFHSDGVQALGKIEFNLSNLPVDLMTFSAHKIHGPKGIGALFVRQGLEWSPFLHGGHQEANLRAGTENVSGIVGFAKAIEQIRNKSKKRTRLSNIQTYFEKNLKQIYPNTKIIGEKAQRSPFISQVAFPGHNNQTLFIKLDLAGIAVSVGSACTSGSAVPSHVLTAMNLSSEIVNSALRFSYSYKTTRRQIDSTLERLKNILRYN